MKTFEEKVEKAYLKGTLKNQEKNSKLNKKVARKNRRASADFNRRVAKNDRLLKKLVLREAKKGNTEVSQGVEKLSEIGSLKALHPNYEFYSLRIVFLPGENARRNQ